MKEKRPVKCPDAFKGVGCYVCGGTYICLEPWRKKRTVTERLKASKEFKRKEPA